MCSRIWGPERVRAGARSRGGGGVGAVPAQHPGKPEDSLNKSRKELKGNTSRV